MGEEVEGGVRRRVGGTEGGGGYGGGKVQVGVSEVGVGEDRIRGRQGT